MSGGEMAEIQRAFDANFVAPAGPQLQEFEASFLAETGFKFCVAVTSGTAAIHLALRGVGVKNGDVVLASSLTFIGSVSPITFLGATPVFIDSDPETWNMCPQLLESQLSLLKREGRNVGAVLPTDLYGQSCDLDRIREVCEKYCVPLVVDSAESLGATYKGRSTGKGASAAIFSFNGNKIITNSGGGMLASDDEALICEARYLSTQARDPVPHFEHRELGYNYRMSNILAAIGISQMSVLQERVTRKREIFSRYVNEFEEIEGLKFMPEANYGRSNRWLTTILVDPKLFGVDKEQIRLALELENIESRPIWKPMHLQPVFEGCEKVGGGVSEYLFEHGLCLPSGTALSDGDIERVAGLVKQLRR